MAIYDITEYILGKFNEMEIYIENRLTQTCARADSIMQLSLLAAMDGTELMARVKGPYDENTLMRILDVMKDVLQDEEYQEHPKGERFKIYQDRVDDIADQAMLSDHDAADVKALGSADIYDVDQRVKEVFVNDRMRRLT